MLKDFFKLDDPFSSFTYLRDLEQHFDEPTVSLLENVEFRPTAVARASSDLFKKKCFKNVSFSFTTFEDVTFSETKFVDCLFLYAEFFHCHFLNCQFVNCNMHKIRLDNCYLDPHSFEMNKVYKKTASNVGTWLFQQLYMNSKNTHQPQFSGESEILFQRWLRAQKKYEWNRDKKKWIRDTKHHGPWRKIQTVLRLILSCRKFFSWWIGNSLFDLVLGFGHRPLRFIAVSAGLLMIASTIVHYSWTSLGLVNNAETLDRGSYVASIYYTTVVMTTLGFGDITPTTDPGRWVAIVLPILGIVWLSLLAAVIIKRIIR